MNNIVIKITLPEPDFGVNSISAPEPESGMCIKREIGTV